MNEGDDDALDEALEATLRRSGPRPGGTALRTQVLAAIAAELAVERAASRWPRLRIVSWAVAASLALGVGMNFWAMREEQQRDARLYAARPPLRRVTEIADAVRSVTDDQTAALFEQQLQAVCRRHELKARREHQGPFLSTQANSPG